MPKKKAAKATPAPSGTPTIEPPAAVGTALPGVAPTNTNTARPLASLTCQRVGIEMEFAWTNNQPMPLLSIPTMKELLEKGDQNDLDFFVKTVEKAVDQKADQWLSTMLWPNVATGLPNEATQDIHRFLTSPLTDKTAFHLRILSALASAHKEKEPSKKKHRKRHRKGSSQSDSARSSDEESESSELEEDRSKLLSLENKASTKLMVKLFAPALFWRVGVTYAWTKMAEHFISHTLCRRKSQS
jgi:hypothetical protein